MSNEEIKRDEFLKNIIKESGTEVPSPDFSETLIHKIQTMPKGKLVANKPVIGKKIWFFIIIGWTGLLLSVILSNTKQEITSNTLITNFQKYMNVFGDLTDKLSGFMQLDSILTTTMVVLAVLITIYIIALEFRQDLYFK